MCSPCPSNTPPTGLPPFLCPTVLPDKHPVCVDFPHMSHILLHLYGNLIFHKLTGPRNSYVTGPSGGPVTQSARTDCSGLIQPCCEYLQGWRTLHSVQLVPVLEPCLSRTVFLCLNVIFCVFICIHWLVILLSTTEQSLTSSSLGPHVKHFNILEKISSQPSPLQAEQPLLSQCLFP